MNDIFKNRRKFHRINYDGQVNLEFCGEKYDHRQIKNLCLTGIFVNGNFSQQHNENCLVKFIDERERREIQLRTEAEVVWTNDVGVALKFTSMTFTSYKLLQKTLLVEAEEPLALLKEFPIISPFEITRL